MRRSLLALAAASLALSLVACGGVEQALDPVAEAADRSADAGSVRIELDASFAAGGTSGAVSAEGVFDDEKGELTIDASGLTSALNLPSELGSFDGQVKVLTATEDGHHVVFVGMPTLASLIPGGKAWIKADVEKLAEASGKDLDGLLDLSGQSPQEMLSLLSRAGTVVEIGAETIDGDATTHYRANVDLAKALAQRGVPAAAIDELLARGVSTELPIDVWIGDDDGLVRRVKFAYDATVQGERVSAGLTMTLSDWGSDVSIDVPSSDEVFDVTPLLGALRTS